MTMIQNRMSRSIAKLDKYPESIRRMAVNFIIKRTIPYVGTSKLCIEEITPERLIVSIPNKRKVQNHIHNVHATAMALIAETATGLLVAMNLPDDKLPLIKSMKIDYKKRSKGAMKAVASFTPEQTQQIKTEPKGSVTVPVTVTDESGESPIQCEMIWAWIPKK